MGSQNHVCELKNIKALGFCVNSTFTISQTEITPVISEFYRFYGTQMPVLVVAKLLFGNYLFARYLCTLLARRTRPQGQARVRR